MVLHFSLQSFCIFRTVKFSVQIVTMSALPRFGFACLILFSICTLTSGRLEPAKIVNNGVYKLEIQSEDKWLTGSQNGQTRSVWRSQPEQKWRFTETKDPRSGEQAWTISPINNVGGLSTLWRVTYVGHGKYRFRSFASGMCLRGSGSNAVVEARCEKDDPGQRWLVLAASE